VVSWAKAQPREAHHSTPRSSEACYGA
jgi:hypothetical protein